MNEALETFASEGLRTLVCSQREISKSEFDAWISEYHDAMAALEDRDEQLEAVAEKIERDLTIVGCTAIEDKLQVQPPLIISSFYTPTAPLATCLLLSIGAIDLIAFSLITSSLKHRIYTGRCPEDYR